MGRKTLPPTVKANKHIRCKRLSIDLTTLFFTINSVTFIEQEGPLNFQSSQPLHPHLIPTFSATPIPYAYLSPCAEPSQCNDRKTDGYVRAVSGQRLGKHIPVKQTREQLPLLESRFIIVQQVDYNNGGAVFSTWPARRGYKRNNVRT
jgi:hypothetical protein